MLRLRQIYCWYSTLFYLRKPIVFLLTAAVAAVSFLTFGKYPYFDGIFLAVLLTLAIANLRDLNLLSVLLIACVDQVSSLLYWQLINIEWLYKLPTYAFILVLAWWLRHAQLGLMAIVVLVITLCAEGYFLLNNHPAPALHFHLLTLFHALLIRRCLFLRTVIFDKWKTKPLHIDWYYYCLLAVIIYLNVIMLGEYLIPNTSFIQYTEYVYLR